MEIDTAHFKGNYPDSATLQGAIVNNANIDSLAQQSLAWPELLPNQKLSMDSVHTFSSQLGAIGPVSHIRLSIFPDGGVSRLRIVGKPHTG